MGLRTSVITIVLLFDHHRLTSDELSIVVVIIIGRCDEDFAQVRLLDTIILRLCGLLQMVDLDYRIVEGRGQVDVIGICSIMI